ncbi:hypothetical protein LTR48_005816 [Friedmanniomyces endolithicus]|uniref:Ubiquitin-like domain-containing protein n=1 Tax=Rachicladosporium monterosium TaxID=1507873 RepID=A0ABR0L316_9PEZI|nr:hypothetical protein LTR48_005816 [Friedmanniomyces endolithicus]KAK1816298.1 hypothetical protein LTR12_009288 [Friedmanniomyces endolithicus]KAK5141797.1 hypothetical protein LTR32_005726 [Rachicladosporium monterosium]
MANSTAYQSPTVEDAVDNPQFETSANGNSEGNGGGNGNNNATVSADDPDPQPQPEPIALIFADVNGLELSFRLKHVTKLGKAMKAFADRTERDLGTLRFLFEGERLLPESTTESMGMEDGDRVEVHHEQIGGGGGGAELPAPECLNVTFADGQGYELFFKIKRSTELGKAMDAFAKRTDREPGTLRFSFKDEPVLPRATAESMGMADYDLVEVQYAQVGGGADGTQAEAVHHEPIEGGAEGHQPETLASLTFADDNGCELTFKLKRNVELGRAMKIFAMWAGKDRDTLRFVSDGERLRDNATMENDYIEDGDRVEVIHEQAGDTRAEMAQAEQLLSALQL